MQLLSFIFQIQYFRRWVEFVMVWEIWISDLEGRSRCISFVSIGYETMTVIRARACAKPWKCPLKQYLRNFATFTKIYWRTRFRKHFFVKGISCCHSNQIFNSMFSQILTFLIFFLLINNFFKTNPRWWPSTLHCVKIKNFLFLLRIKFSFQFVSFICPFFKNQKRL